MRILYIIGLSGKAEESSGGGDSHNSSSKFICIQGALHSHDYYIFADAAVAASVSVVVVLITLATIALIIFGIVLYLRKR